MSNKKTLNFILIICYIMTQFTLVLKDTDFFLFASRFSKIQLLYILLAGLYFFSSYNGLLPKKIFILVSLLCLHTVLFGLIFTNKTVIHETHEHFKGMFIFLLMLVCSTYFFGHKDYLALYIRLNYYVLAIAMLLCGITHHNDFLNPIGFIKYFLSGHIYRTSFGFGHANFTGNYLIFTLIYSFFILEGDFQLLHKSKGYRYELIMVIFIDAILFEMLLSTESRTSIMAGGVFLLIYYFQNMKKKVRLSTFTKILIFVMLFWGVICLWKTGFLDQIWEHSNRSQNIDVNLQYFRLFNPWVGMGYLPGYAFLTYMYGYPTWPVDIYFVYILFTTGYIGCLIMFFFFFLLFMYLKRVDNPKNKRFAISLLGAVLFAGIGQTHVLSYTLHSSVINWIIIMLSLYPSTFSVHRNY